MKVAIVGGKLQGTEAVYLAKKAGIQSLLIDKKENRIAFGLCDEYASRLLSCLRWKKMKCIGFCRE